MKSFKSIISAGLLLYVSLGISQIAEAQDEARTEAIELYNNAQDLAQNSNFAEAIELYREALNVARTNQLDDISDLVVRSEEHTSELQLRGHLVCRLLLENKNKKNEQ